MKNKQSFYYDNGDPAPNSSLPIAIQWKSTPAVLRFNKSELGFLSNGTCEVGYR